MAVTVTAITPGTKPMPAAAQKKGLRGAMLSLPYIGPARIASGASHARTAPIVAGGGTEDTDGYRKSDNFDNSGNTGGMMGAPATSVSRPNPGAVPATLRATAAFIGAGVPGGSTPGAVIDASGRAAEVGVDRFGRTKGVALSGAGLGTYKYTNFDGRATVDGDGGQALGSAQQTKDTGTSQPDSIDGETIAQATKTVGSVRIGPGAVSASTVTPTLPKPTFGAVSAGVVAIADGTGQNITIDMHTDDLTGGAQKRAGCVASVYRRKVSDDTDEDGQCLGVFSVDGTTGATTLVNTVTSGTYVVYVRFRAQRPAKDGPTSFVYGPIARTTIAIA